MRRWILSYLLLLVAKCQAFSPATPRGAVPTTSLDAQPTDDKVSRRVALATAAAALAATPPALAASASLEHTVTALERANMPANARGAPEKHLPAVRVTADGVITVVVPHVMDAEQPHFIQYVWLKDLTSNAVVAVQAFQATDASPPTLTTASVRRGSTVKPMLYCNLHGLWEGEPLTV